MYDKIVNPLTGRKVSVSGKIGNSILNGYLTQLGGSSSSNNPSRDSLQQSGLAKRRATLKRRAQIESLTATISGEIQKIRTISSGVTVS
jgi:hypothetical protein